MPGRSLTMEPNTFFLFRAPLFLTDNPEHCRRVWVVMVSTKWWLTEVALCDNITMLQKMSARLGIRSCQYWFYLYSTQQGNKGQITQSWKNSAFGFLIKWEHWPKIQIVLLKTLCFQRATSESTCQQWWCVITLSSHPQESCTPFKYLSFWFLFYTP